jgi:hypothetical protein
MFISCSAHLARISTTQARWSSRATRTYTGSPLPSE